MRAKHPLGFGIDKTETRLPFQKGMASLRETIPMLSGV
ncbi:hypothetical protein HDEF_1065 [Candidatus Hamiltonella defensa 5AT (Acyrthosiphon pisum)]|uniref:Uncharacterized protein n=1 Tax=Hamiltonella defensa subsp. Acyrthosiphon pisum (strain 5AT) TaxID=572265 RepID=C4K5A4_HAMD5|nr:hypothetical protein HDEF_1065 [Candidatus Hamiltonella defensa 5AT (Acyrthosiphon pisum)]